MGNFAKNLNLGKRVLPPPPPPPPRCVIVNNTGIQICSGIPNTQVPVCHFIFRNLPQSPSMPIKTDISKDLSQFQ